MKKREGRPLPAQQAGVPSSSVLLPKVPCLSALERQLTAANVSPKRFELSVSHLSFTHGMSSNAFVELPLNFDSKFVLWA